MITYILIGFVILASLLAVFVFVKNSRRGLSEKDQRFFIVKWQEILNLAEHDSKHAVVDADKLLDCLLSKKGYSGNVGEKLKKAAPTFTDLNGVWNAHKLRNRIAHELDVEVSSTEIKVALSQFKRAMQDLGIKL